MKRVCTNWKDRGQKLTPYMESNLDPSTVFLTEYSVHAPYAVRSGAVRKKRQASLDFLLSRKRLGALVHSSAPGRVCLRIESAKSDSYQAKGGERTN